MAKNIRYNRVFSMKKLIFIFVILLLYLFIIKQKLATAFIEKINLNLLDDEIAVIFLSSDDYKTILLKDNAEELLLILDLKNDKILKKSLNKFLDNKLDYLFYIKPLSNLNIDSSIRDVLSNRVDFINFYITKHSNIITISNDNYNFCIYDIGENNDVTNCDFVYFSDMNNQINISENLKAIFYEKKVANNFKENTYIKWIDNYELNVDAYNILKISKNNYDIITIPIEN